MMVELVCILNQVCESPEELAKARMQMSALLCKLLQTSQVPVPEKGRRLQ